MIKLFRYFPSIVIDIDELMAYYVSAKAIGLVAIKGDG